MPEGFRSGIPPLLAETDNGQSPFLGHLYTLPFWVLGGPFALTIPIEHPAIHPVFRNFQYFYKNKMSRPKHQKVVF